MNRLISDIAYLYVLPSGSLTLCAAVHMSYTMYLHTEIQSNIGVFELKFVKMQKKICHLNLPILLIYYQSPIAKSRDKRVCKMSVCIFQKHPEMIFFEF